MQIGEAPIGDEMELDVEDGLRVGARLGTLVEFEGDSIPMGCCVGDFVEFEDEGLLVGFRVGALVGNLTVELLWEASHLL